MYPLGKDFDLVPGVVPVDLQTAQAGDWVSLKNASGICFIVFKAAGTAGDDPDFDIDQATDVSGTGAKALSEIRTIYKKQGTLTGVGTWSEVSQAASDVFSADGTSAEEQALYVIQVNADQLDVDGGFDCVRMNVADVGNNAQLGCVLYLLYGLRYATAPENLPNVITN